MTTQDLRRAHAAHQRLTCSWCPDTATRHVGDERACDLHRWKLRPQLVRDQRRFDALSRDIENTRRQRDYQQLQKRRRWGSWNTQT